MSSVAPKNAKTEEMIVEPNDVFMSRDALDSFDASNVADWLENLGLSEEDLQVAGSDWELTDKDDLVDLPFVIVEWEHKPSQQFGGMYAIVRAVIPESGAKVVFADGGSGVASQLLKTSTERRDKGLPSNTWQHGLNVKHGLTRSDYDAHTSNVTGEVVPAGTTYYLS